MAEKQPSSVLYQRQVLTLLEHDLPGVQTTRSGGLHPQVVSYYKVTYLI